VSFLVPTHGRLPEYGHLLEEVVYWFSVQTYDRERRELIILNDAPNQRLLCYTPGVVVINLRERIPTLGDKRNLLQDAARGEILIPWDDDDISLPGRAARAVERIRTYAYWNPGARWFQQGGKLHHTHPQNCTHHASAWRKSAGLRYRSVTHGEDVTFMSDARAAGNAAPAETAAVGDWDYVYRWGVTRLHLSAFGDQNTVYSAQAGRPPAGEFLIEPRMYRDYAAECRAIVESLTGEEESCPTTTSTSACGGSATPCPCPRSSATCTRPSPA
jgi:glycosyltransferase involved in cell wall biosynthesis